MKRVVCKSFVTALAMLAGMGTAGVNAQEAGEKAPPLPSYATARDGTKDPSLIKWRDAMWQFYQLVNALEQREPGRGRSAILEHELGLSEQTSQALVAHIRSAIEQSKQHTRSLMEAQCAEFRSKSLTARAEDVQIERTDLASRFDTLNRADRQQHLDQFTHLREVLQPAEIKRLNVWLNRNVRPSMVVIDIDYPRMLADAGVEPRKLLARMCTSRPAK